MKQKTVLKAQSAMEYLMTYGWAILIISVVLGALFSLGVFSGASLIGTTCVASPGYYCSGVTYSHSTGNILFTIGQSTGLNWVNTAFIYAPQGTASTTNAPSVTFANDIGGLYSGQQTTISWGVSSTSTAVGTITAGTIWACYTTTSSGNAIAGAVQAAGSCNAIANTVYYVQIATLTAKAV